MIDIVREGNGRYITEEDLNYVENHDTREWIRRIAGGLESIALDTPYVLNMVQSWRKDESISPEYLRRAVYDLIESGLLDWNTVVKEKLDQKYPFADNPNFGELETYIGTLVNGVKNPKEKLDLKNALWHTAENAITMNKELIGEDFDKLQVMLSQATDNDQAKKLLNTVTKVANLMLGKSIQKQIRNLGKSDVQTFLKDKEAGQYDLLLNYEYLQRPEVISKRSESFESMQDTITAGLTGYADYEDLKKNGTDFEKLLVNSNAAYLSIGGTLEKALTGSLGVQAKGMRIIGDQWAFSDDVEGVYFVPTDTNVVGRGTLGWGMIYQGADGKENTIRFQDYVDPQLAYNIERLTAETTDPLFLQNYEKAKNPENTGMYQNVPENASYKQYWGAKPNPDKVDVPKYDSYLEGFEKKFEDLLQMQQELEVIQSDLMTYRYNILGVSAPTTRKRL